MTPTQKNKIAEQFPFGLLVIAFVFYVLCGCDFYSWIYPYISKVINCCLVFCFFAWLVSPGWGSVSKRSIIGLFLLNILDLFYTELQTDWYYHLYSIIIFQSMNVIFLIDFYAYRKNKRLKKSG